MSARVISLSEFREKRDAADARAGRSKEQKLLTHMGFTSELADSISLEEAYAIAQGIVQKYSANGALLKAFLKRQRREPSDEKSEEMHEVLKRQVSTVSQYSTQDLKALFALYKKDPKEYFETYILPAAEEYVRRFEVPSREEA